MARQIHAFVFAQRTVPVNVIAIHRELAKIMRERSDAQRESVAGPQLKRSGKLIRNRGDARSVRVRIGFEFISPPGKILKNFDHRRVCTFDRFDRWHYSKSLTTYSSDQTTVRERRCLRDQ